MRSIHPGRRPTKLLVALFAVLALVAAACGGAADGPAATSTSSSTSSSTTASTVAAVESGFVAFGDSGGGPAQAEVARAMGRWATDHRVDALVTTGDNVYDFGEPEHFEAQLDEPYRALREDRPLWVTLGNHDVVRGFGDEQLDHLGLPDLPYARELPGVQVLFLDGNRPDGDQARWLDERLSAAGPPFRVVSLHQPAYSCGPHGPTAGVLQTWVPVFEEHEVALVLSGHDHLYQRLTSEGVTYVVTGGGGRALYELEEPCEFDGILDAAAEEHHFVGVEVSGGTMTVTAVATDGEVLDRVEITR